MEILATASNEELIRSSETEIETIISLSLWTDQLLILINTVN